MYKDYYNRNFTEIFGASLQVTDGLAEITVQTELAARQLLLPQALMDYYAIAGQHWINKHHNLLYSIQELEWVGNKLVFMEENQSVAFWGILETDLREADPIVWQGVNGESLEWYSEDLTVSQFLMEMWRWTLAEA
jgi:hypothetical protein